MKIAFSSNVCWSIFNFRMELLKTLRDDGYQVCVIGSLDAYSQRLIDEGFDFHDIAVENNTINPLHDVRLMYRYYKLYRKLTPDLILHNAIKPNIYGTIAASFLRIPTINNISGLGTLFIEQNVSTRIAKILYRVSQKRAAKVFFQNNDDRALFIENRLVDKALADFIPGSGVDTEKFCKDRFAVKANSRFQFLFVGRVLRDKGIVEYVDAAQQILKRHNNVEFNILGTIATGNTTSVSKEQLDAWIGEGLIRYLGETDDVAAVLAKADCVVLPSYREGLSKVLIEASSMALPIVTTKVPGCRDVVIHNETGFLCEPQNAKDLETQMENMLLLTESERNAFGLKARERAINEFDSRIVIRKYTEAIKTVLQSEA